MAAAKGRGRVILVILALLGALAIIAALNAPRLESWALHLLYPRKFSDTVAREAGEFDLPEALVYAVIKAESGFDPKACSRAGAHGLMQLTDGTFAWMAMEHPPENGGHDVYDVGDNVHCGCALLRRLLDHYALPETALAAYNAGIGNVDRWLADPACSGDGRSLKHIPYPETAAYVERVAENWRVYRGLYGDG